MTERELEIRLLNILHANKMLVNSDLIVVPEKRLSVVGSTYDYMKKKQAQLQIMLDQDVELAEVNPETWTALKAMGFREIAKER